MALSGRFNRAHDRTPVVELWVTDTNEGQSVIVVGERSDGQRFFGSFWQPRLDETRDTKEDR